jgi:toxin ParE1/3/4
MRLEWSELALADLDRFAEFLHKKFPHLAARVATAIIEESRILIDHPRLGRSIGGRDEYRQLSLRVLKGVYVFQYRIEGERIVMLRVFHGRESRR